MGLGPSIKMTTLHHYQCPATKVLSADPEIEFLGILVDGVSELCEDKQLTAGRTAALAEGMRADGAIVAIDGWGNHHVDFVEVIGQLGRRGIPSVGLSYIGQQGRLVCSNEYVDTVVDFNKCESGYESCVVGQNNLTELDAFKAAALLKSKMRKVRDRPSLTAVPDKPLSLGRLIRRTIPVRDVQLGGRTTLEGGVLTIRRGLEAEAAAWYPQIKRMTMTIVRPGDGDFFVNSNLDFMPIACKASGQLGEGITHRLGGVTLMLTGVEEKTGFQPSNIGSSEGMFRKQVVLDQAGTPRSTDFLLHLDVLFAAGEGRTAEGVQAAHEAADRVLREIPTPFPRPCLAERICTTIGMDKIFFQNSGAEANEAMIKMARKYGVEKYGPHKYNIVTARMGFHGRTFGAMSATGQPDNACQIGFGDMTPGFSYADFNDLQSFKDACNENTIGIMIEPVQGEGGVYPATKEFMCGLRDFCDEQGILLLLDEVQSGWCRTGAVMAYMNYGIKPDIVSMAKALGGGMPIGAICATDEVAKAFTPGCHGSTFGGNPLSCAAALAEMDELLDKDLAGNAKRMGDYISNELEALPHVKEVRHQGCLIGVEFDGFAPSVEIKHKCLEKHLLITALGGNVIRLVPPLILTEDDCDKAASILREAVLELSA